MWECLGEIITLLQVTGSSVFLLARQWNIYLNTRELCAPVLTTLTLGVVQHQALYTNTREVKPGNKCPQRQILAKRGLTSELA